MRLRPSLLVLVALLGALAALGVVACGGDDDDGDAGLDRPELSVPESGPAPTTTAPTTTSTTQTTDGAGSDSGDSADDGGGSTDESGGAGGDSGSQGPSDTPANDQRPPPGSPAERAEQFCRENPDACSDHRAP